MKKIRTYTYVYILILIILVMQLFDSYCTDLFSKLQSFLLSDFLIDGRGMSVSEAVSYMGYATLPFYVIPLLAPLARIAIDKIGIKPLFILNIGVLVAGCLICAYAPSLIIYLIGNGIVIFASSMDIQYIYIAEEVPEHRRATIRGIAAGVSAAATMLIPVFRSQLIDARGYSWRSLYKVGIGIGMGTILISLLLKQSVRKKHTKQTESQTVDSTSPEQTEANRKAIKNLYVCLFIFGIATSGITLYNEPILAFGKASEAQISSIMLIQPIVTLFVNVISGYLSDKIGRETIIRFDILLAAIALCDYVLGAWIGQPAWISGIAWGLMIGCYFSAANLMILTVLELAEEGKIGKISAISNYANGAGNAIGLLICTCLVKYTGMGAIKLLSSIPVFLISFIYLKQKNPFCRITS